MGISSKVGKFATECFKEYKRPLHKYLLRRLRRPDDIDDVSQEVYERLLKMDEDLIVEKPLAYVYGIASRAVADHMFDLKQRTPVDWGKDADGFLDSPACALPDDIADSLNLQQQIDRAMAQLPPTHAAVLLAHKRDGLSYEEVAEKLGLSIFTVEKYVSQAKARIRTMSWER